MKSKYSNLCFYVYIQKTKHKVCFLYEKNKFNLLVLMKEDTDKRYFSKVSKHLHDRIISLRRDVLPHKTRLLWKCLYQFMKVSGHIFVLGIMILQLSTIFPLYFGTVPTVWYFCFSICQCYLNRE